MSDGSIGGIKAHQGKSGAIELKDLSMVCSRKRYHGQPYPWRSETIEQRKRRKSRNKRKTAKKKIR